MVDDTKECVEECPNDFPLEFNKKCYKSGNCPDGTHEDILEGKKCLCDGLYFKQDNGNFYCLEEKKLS